MTRRLLPEPTTAQLIADTLAMMYLIDRTEEFADCYLWTGATHQSGHPIYKPHGCPCTLVRRAMFQLSGRRLVPRVPIETTCDEKLCINPAHLRKTTVARIAQRKAAAGGWTGVLRCSKIATTKRASPLAKLTIELAREIRLSDETNIVLAERHDVDPSLIQGIKAGKRWRDYSNPFAGLMA